MKFSRPARVFVVVVVWCGGGSMVWCCVVWWCGGGGVLVVMVVMVWGDVMMQLPMRGFDGPWVYHGEWSPSGSPLAKNPRGLQPLRFWPWDFPRDSIHHYTPSAFPHIVPVCTAQLSIKACPNT